MQRFYIIADDLTGANDAGVQLSKIGISSTVFLDFKGTLPPSTNDVAIIDTDSRGMMAASAYETVYKASSFFYQQGYEHVYKKMDSTLRGNIAEELEAVVSVHQPEIVVIAPAFPKMNRQTINGHQYVNGQPVSETEFGKDPKTPVKNSFIPNLFRKYVKDRICLIDHSLLNSSDLEEEIMKNIIQGKSWFICDAITDKDLETIADTFAKANKKTVWAGSAGLIEHLPKILKLNKANNQQEDISIAKTLTVSASLSSVTKQQLEMVRANPDAYFIELDPVSLIRKTYCSQEIVATLMRQTEKKHYVLFVDSSIHNRNSTKQLETELSLTKTQISEAISKELGVLTRAVVHSLPDIGGLILTGGDTAKAVCSQLNMNQIYLYTEIEAGMPLGKLRSGVDSRTFWAVTKAGGFGNEHSLLKALTYMIRRVD